MRLFLAIPLSINAKESILNSYNELIGKINAKWVAKENLHITLKFLGNVEKDIVKEIEENMDDVREKHKKCVFTITDLGAFPSLKLIRVLFYKIVPPEPFIDLSRDIDTSLEKFNFKKEEEFFPHITIARLKIPIRNLDLEFNKSINLTETADRFNLMESVLNPSGPVYSVIREFKLKGV